MRRYKITAKSKGGVVVSKIEEFFDWDLARVTEHFLMFDKFLFERSSSNLVLFANQLEWLQIKEIESDERTKSI